MARGGREGAARERVAGEPVGGARGDAPGAGVTGAPLFFPHLLQVEEHLGDVREVIALEGVGEHTGLGEHGLSAEA